MSGYWKLWNRIAALLLGLSLFTGGALAANAAPATQGTGTPAARSASGTRTEGCAAEDEQGDGQEDENENGEDRQADDQDNVQDENGADDAAEGDTDADTAADEAAENQNGEDDEDDDGKPAKPGELSEGQDLLPKAKVPVEQAVAAAQTQASGALGSVELEEKDGTLVFEVTVGDQEVFVDATDGTIASVERMQRGTNEGDDEDGCAEDGRTAQPGTLADGRDLLPEAKLTVEQAVQAAQGAATGRLGEVDLERVDGTLVFSVDVGEQDVRVDATTGAVVGIDAED